MDVRRWVQKVKRSIAQRVEASEREIAKEFAAAIRELTLIINDYFLKYEQDGKLTLEEMNRYNRLNQMFADFDAILKARYKRIYNAIYDALGFTYSQSWNMTAWQIETSAAADLGFSTATNEQLDAAINGAYALVPLVEVVEYQRSSALYNLKREMRTGLDKGETYKSIASRIAPFIQGNQNRAITTARTEGHRVMEQGGLQAAKKANDVGVVMVKEWNSSRDERVRKNSKANHRKLDGVKIPVDDLFQGISGKGAAPGQMGSAAEDVNCRCFLTYEVVKLDPGKYNKQEEQAFDAWESLKRAG